MNFCYLDESGTGEEPYATMAGIVVNSRRMEKTKDDWRDLLDLLTKLSGRYVKEFHARDFYAGRGIWKGTDGRVRSAVISAIFDWLGNRKHKIVFCGVDKKKYLKSLETNQKLKDIGSLWCVLGLHQLLSIQKALQRDGAKGYVAVVFDEELKEKDRITDLAINPPSWTDTYYGKTKKESRLNKIVDVPYFGDSKKVHLLQVADLVALLLRRYTELEDGAAAEKYDGEKNKVTAWVKHIVKLSYPSSTRYMKSGRCDCAELFFTHAPPAIRSL